MEPAAEQGDAAAQHNLGVMYAKGEGVPQNDVQAYAWWSVAAAQGLENAIKSKAILKKLMTPAQIAKGQELGVDCTLTNDTRARHDR